MKGTPIYVVRMLRESEKVLINDENKKKLERIIWQQGVDGFPSFRHYGILLSDNSVVHFTGSIDTVANDACIRRTSLNYFCDGNNYCIANDVDCAFSKNIIAARAMSQVNCNFGGYNFLRNNCEHFANWCANGHKISRQVFFRWE